MSEHRDGSPGGLAGIRVAAARAGGAAFAALEQLAGGLGTALLALAVLTWFVAVALGCLVGVGLLAVPGALRLLRSLADRERERLSRWGPDVVAPGPAPTRLRVALADPMVRRELRWLAAHATLGLLLGLVGVLLPVLAVRDITFPL
jgi:Putative sensor